MNLPTPIPRSIFLYGVTFEDYDEATHGTAAEYLRDTAHMWLTGMNDANVHSGISIAERENGNKVINLAGSAYYANSNVQVLNPETNKTVNAFNQEKYEMSKTLIDLLCGATGPKNFTLSLDMTINGEDGTKALSSTSDSSGVNYLSTYYRGVSTISFLGYKWNIKATAANIPTYTVDDEGYAVVGDESTVLENQGYLYSSTQVATIKAKEATDTGMWSLSSKYTYEKNGQTGSAIAPEYMTEGNRVTYTLNKPFNVKMDFTRVSSSKMSVVTYVENKEFSTIEYEIGTDASKNFGLRLFDQTANVDLDNIKVEVPTASVADYEVEVVNTPNAFVAKYFTTVNRHTANGLGMRSALPYVDYAIGSDIANNISDVLNGKTLALTAPANKAYWVAFDVNTPADYAKKDINVVTFGKTGISLTALLPDAVANSSYAVAFKLEPAATEGEYDIYIFVDGEFKIVEEGIAINGNSILLNADGVNLRNVKAVDKLVSWMAVLPGFDEDTAYVSSVAEYVTQPCVTHTPKDGTYKMYEIPCFDLNGANQGIWSYVCSECGIRVYIEQGVNLKTTYAAKPTQTAFDGKFIQDTSTGYGVTANKNVGFDTKNDTYVLSFTIDLNNADNIPELISKSKANGACFIDFTGSNSVCRLLTIGLNGDKPYTLEEMKAGTKGTHYGVAASAAYTDAILLADRQSDTITPYAVLELGKRHEITIVGRTDGADTDTTTKVYVNGVLATDSLAQRITEVGNVRFPDTSTSGRFSDFVFSAYVDSPEHICSGDWSEDGKLIVTDTAVKYSYTCYCGEASESYITNVVVDDIPYINGYHTVEYTAPAGEYWMFTDAYIPAGNTGAVISLGETVILNADGYSGNYSIAVKVNGNTYTVYVDGKKTANGSYTGDSAFAFSSIPSCTYTKIVELGVTDTPAVPKVNGSYHEHAEDALAKTPYDVGTHIGYRFVCSECGDAGYRNFEYDIYEKTDLNVNNNAALAPLYEDDYLNLKTQDGALFTTTLTVNSLPDTWASGNNKSLITWLMSTPDNVATYIQWIRIFYAEPSEEAPDVKRAEIKLHQNGKYIAFENSPLLVEGETYDIAVYFDINNAHYDLYVDGKYVGGVDQKLDYGDVENANTRYNVRLADGSAGSYVATDWRVAVDHKHENDGTVKVLSYDKVGLYIDRTCTACGVDYVEYVNHAVVNNIYDVCDGYETVEFTAPAGEYWLTTEVNMRTQSSGNLVTLGNDVILDTDDVTITAPNTVQVAVRVNGRAYTLYVDGAEHSNGTLSAVPTSVTYGENLTFGAYVRFNNNKVITSEQITDSTRAVAKADTSVKNCTHSHAVGAPVKAINHYSFGRDNVAYICKNCGERVYADISDSLIVLADGNVASQYSKSNSTMHQIGVEDYSLSSKATPYWIMFDLDYYKLNLSDTDSTTSINDIQNRRWKGWGLINAMSSSTGGDQRFNSELRLLPDGWEKDEATETVEEVEGKTVTTLTKGEGNGYDGIYVFGPDYRQAKKVVDVKAGSKHHFALYINPANGDYDVYLDGEYVTKVTAKGGEGANSTPMVRVFESDGFKGGNVQLTNFVVAREAQNYDGKSVVIETKATFTASETVTEAGTYESLINATRVKLLPKRSEDPVLNFLYVDVYTGQLAYKNGEEYVLFYTREGEPICLNETAKDIVVIYDDDAKTVRYYIGGYIPHVAVTGEGEEIAYKLLGTVTVENTAFCTASSCRADSIDVNYNYIDKLSEVKVSTMNGSGTAEVIGYQRNSITNAVRVVAGVDMRYFNGIGYDISVKDAEGNDVTNTEKSNVYGNTVFYTLNAEGKDIYAAKYGYDYFSALEIKANEEGTIPEGHTITVTPYTTIGDSDTKLCGEAVEIAVTADGYEFLN